MLPPSAIIQKGGIFHDRTRKVSRTYPASQLYEELISYADLYDSASFEAKKMIVSQLIRRVEVYRGYQIHVDFNFDLAQYLENSDELAC